MPLTSNTLRYFASRDYVAVPRGDGTYVVGGPGAEREERARKRGGRPVGVAWFGGAIFDEATQWPETPECQS